MAKNHNLEKRGTSSKKGNLEYLLQLHSKTSKLTLQVEEMKKQIGI